jgi:release factor glutamine methyltransferase
MIVKDVLDKTVQFFKDKKIETARLDAELLLCSALGYKNRVDIYLKFEEPLKEPELVKCRDFVRRRSQGEPVAYILGEKYFYGFAFKVSPAVLIPRPESELLIEQALKWIQKNNFESLCILDLGTGSGCLGLTLAKKIPQAQLTLVDASAEALAIAKENADQLMIADRVQVIHSKVEDLQDFAQPFDLIIANPPYIAPNDSRVEEGVQKFEPHLALFSEDNGLGALRSWSHKAAAWLAPKAWMGFEMGADQSEDMKKHFAGLSIFDSISVIKDLSGHSRHIIGEKNG